MQRKVTIEYNKSNGVVEHYLSDEDHVFMKPLTGIEVTQWQMVGGEVHTGWCLFPRERTKVECTDE